MKSPYRLPDRNDPVRKTVKTVLTQTTCPLKTKAHIQNYTFERKMQRDFSVFSKPCILFGAPA